MTFSVSRETTSAGISTLISRWVGLVVSVSGTECPYCLDPQQGDMLQHIEYKRDTDKWSNSLAPRQVHSFVIRIPVKERGCFGTWRQSAPLPLRTAIS